MGTTTTNGMVVPSGSTSGSRSRSGSTAARKHVVARSRASGSPAMTSASTCRSNSSSASVGQAATGSALMESLSCWARRSFSGGPGDDRRPLRIPQAAGPRA